MRTMATTLPGPELPVTEEDLIANREYGELYSAYRSQNGWLKLITLGQTCVIAVLGWSLHSAWSRPAERIYVRIDEIGRAAVVSPNAFALKPQEHELKHHLTRFVHLHLSRRQHTITEDFPNSLWYLDATLRARVRGDMERDDVVKKTIMSSTDQEVVVHQVVLRETEKKPYTAEIDYSIRSVDRASKQVASTRDYTATVEYGIADNIPAEVVPYNPIGLGITHFRTDEAFRSNQR